MEQTRGYYNTFVVKIWHGKAEGIMRGHIQHVSSQEHAHFFTLGNMSNFILNHLGPPPGDFITQDETKSKSTILTEDIGDFGEHE
jgi:hypothetical protein